jgi:hypothetical protein
LVSQQAEVSGVVAAQGESPATASGCQSENLSSAGELNRDCRRPLHIDRIESVGFNRDLAVPLQQPPNDGLVALKKAGLQRVLDKPWFFVRAFRACHQSRDQHQATGQQHAEGLSDALGQRHLTHVSLS